MARKRSTPKPPAAIPFPDVPREGLADMLGGLSAIVDAVRTRRVVLLRSHVVADPDADAFDAAGMVSLDLPQSVHHYDPKTRRLQVICHCGLTASWEHAKGRKKKAAAPLLTVEASFLLEYDIDADVDLEINEVALELVRETAVGQAWPYWREFVRDASTRAGLPVIDVPFEVEE